MNDKIAGSNGRESFPGKPHLRSTHYLTIAPFLVYKRHGEVAKTSTRRDITVKMTSPTSALRIATTALLFAVVVTATVISEAGELR
ncbi:WSSV358 [White spot syndrome virus]|uniref:WSSV358 n=1 Tax=White spot syndrome virus TaxID=342409 RepID=A0A2I6SC52_9VIRU|nr:WSSV358 [White spot syndrome virus]